MREKEKEKKKKGYSNKDTRVFVESEQIEVLKKEWHVNIFDVQRLFLYFNQNRLKIR